MSVKLITLAWDNEEVRGTELLTLLALCDASNDEGLCYPSVSTLARKCRTTSRTVQKTLKKLEEKGLVHRQLGGGRTTTIYKVTPVPQDTPVTTDTPVTSDTPPPSPVTPLPRHHGHPTPVTTDTPLVIENRKGTVKRTKKTARVPTHEDISYPSTLDTMEFKGAWTEYISYRRERRLSRLTQRTINRQLHQLEQWGHDAAIQSIEITITKGWQGLFEPKPDPLTQKRKLTDADHAAGF